jgi:hypothetical protein
MHVVKVFNTGTRQGSRRRQQQLQLPNCHKNRPLSSFAQPLLAMTTIIVIIITTASLTSEPLGRQQQYDSLGGSVRCGGDWWHGRRTREGGIEGGSG